MTSKEVKQLYQIIENQWGIRPTLDYAFLKSDERIYLISKDIKNINLNLLKVNSMGLYIGELNRNQLRLSVEGSQLLGPFAQKNVVDISKLQLAKWLRGEEIECDAKNAFVIVKHGEDYFGCGKAKDGRILNYVPKTRRLEVIPDSQEESLVSDLVFS
jgi:NOL1/NOP2/fmu family ribosome biogenesis protein